MHVAGQVLGLYNELKRIQTSSIKLHVQYSERGLFLFSYFSIFIFFLSSFCLFSLIHRQVHCTVSLRAHKNGSNFKHISSKVEDDLDTVAVGKHTCMDSAADLNTMMLWSIISSLLMCHPIHLVFNLKTVRPTLFSPRSPPR